MISFNHWKSSKVVSDFPYELLHIWKPLAYFHATIEVLSCDESFALSAYILFMKITSSKIESELVSKWDIKC